MPLPLVRVGQIEAEKPEVPVEPPKPRNTTPVLTASIERQAVTAAEHLQALTAGHKVYDLSTGTIDVPAKISQVRDMTVPQIQEEITLSPTMQDALQLLHDYPGCSIRDLAGYRAAKEGVPVRTPTQIDIWQAKNDLRALREVGLVTGRYSENTTRYWLTEQGLLQL